MKVKVKKSELYECVKNAVVRAINEAQGGAVNEDFVDDFIKNNPLPKTSKEERERAHAAAQRDGATDDEDGGEEKAEKQPDSKKPKRGPAKRFVPSRFRQ